MPSVVGKKRNLLIMALISQLLPTHDLSAQNAKPSAKDIVEKIQQYYASSEDYQATFVQTTSHKMFSGRLERSYGTVKFKKGGLMRWEYNRPEKKLFIYDGKTLWIYEPEVPQVISGTADAEKLRRALTFLSGDGKILDEYNVSVMDPKQLRFSQGMVLGLVPKDKKSSFKRIELYLDPATYRVVRSVVVDQENNRNRLDFKSPKLSNTISPKEFSFTPPKGVPVITPEQQ
jgi:outer membrane lipoprotein carrier protein